MQKNRVEEIAGVRRCSDLFCRLNWHIIRGNAIFRYDNGNSPDPARIRVIAQRHRQLIHTQISAITHDDEIGQLWPGMQDFQEIGLLG